MSKSQTPQNPGGPVRPLGQLVAQIISGLILIFVIISLYSFFSETRVDTSELTLSELALEIKSENVEKIVVEGSNLEVTLADGSIAKSKKESEGTLTESLANFGLTTDEIAALNVEISEPSGFFVVLGNLAPYLFPLIFIIFFIWLLTRQARGSAMQAFSFGESKARIINPDDAKEQVTFKNVAGAKEAKEELAEIVDFLKNPKKFLSIGARIPKGVLLMGAPGTGKTLLARAVAGEAKVPFFYLSGSEFVEMFVGVGASRVRDLFKMAKKGAPAIIFVDEIDAVGRHRGSGYGGGNDEREQTLNQILVEMDGFEPNDKVIVMAATNRPDVLDPALLRPGRFDRRVMLDLPDLKDREEILGIHSSKVPLYKDVDLHVIAERTPGFSGADLSNLMNEAAILAAREDRKQVSQYDLIRSVEKVMLGPERKSHVLSEEEKKITAYHEAGHALVFSLLPDADPVHKVSVISRGRALGFTMKLPVDEKKLHNRASFYANLAGAMGGYVAEELVFGDTSTGPSNDIAHATAMVRDMVAKYGMSDKVGPVAYDNSPSLDQTSGVIRGKAFSEEKAALLDAEVERIVKESLDTARKLLKKHRSALDAIADELMECETLEEEEFNRVLVAQGIKPKREAKA